MGKYFKDVTTLEELRKQYRDLLKKYQMDDLNNNAYIDVLEGLEDVTELYNDRYVDMDTITGYSGTDDGLMIYTEDGNGYYLEVGMMD